jgi:hypothetical protein
MSGPMAPWETEEVDQGCSYILDDCGVGQACGAARRHASPYCPTHHALCHVAYGSPAEAVHLRTVEALASAVGGRRSRQGGEPSRSFLKRLERAARVRSFVR